uniref:Protein TEX261 n=1 Tax=Macrostomum lignano TaxID=282301 RepID=A0A1I8JMM4_9PLAT
LVEEYTVFTCKLIRWLIIGTLALHAALLLLEDAWWSLIAVGVLAHLLYASLLKTYPGFQFSSPSFILSALLLLAHHYLAFAYFAEAYRPFLEVLAFFTFLVWPTPFLLVISLSANELVLPQTEERSHLMMPGSSGVLYADDGSSSHFVSAYLKGRRRGLLYFLNNLRDSLLPNERLRFSQTSRFRTAMSVGLQLAHQVAQLTRKVGRHVQQIRLQAFCASRKFSQPLRLLAPKQVPFSSCQLGGQSVLGTARTRMRTSAELHKFGLLDHQVQAGFGQAAKVLVRDVHTGAFDGKRRVRVDVDFEHLDVKQHAAAAAALANGRHVEDAAQRTPGLAFQPGDQEEVR